MSVFIIAEAGVNHNGNLELTRRMVREAAEAGADAVKFQTFTTAELVTPDAPKAEYQKISDDSVSQYEMLRKLELTPDAHRVLIEDCRKYGIEFMSTPFSVTDARLLASLGMKTWKIPSGEVTNLPLLEFVGALKPSRVIMSTGMCTLDEIGASVDALCAAGTPRDNIVLLHCTTSYPAKPDEVNLLAMNTLRSFRVGGVGYSDHTRGTAVAVAAAALGACVVEKHFTTDRNLPGPDHKASLTCRELACMVSDIRVVESALGTPDKRVTDSERPNMSVSRKSIVAARIIHAGETFTADNLTTKRPGTGLSPMLWHTLIGRQAKHDYNSDNQIEKDEII